MYGVNRRYDGFRPRPVAYMYSVATMQADQIIKRNYIKVLKALYNY